MRNGKESERERESAWKNENTEGFGSRTFLWGIIIKHIDRPTTALLIKMPSVCSNRVAPLTGPKIKVKSFKADEGKERRTEVLRYSQSRNLLAAMAGAREGNGSTNYREAIRRERRSRRPITFQDESRTEMSVE